MQAYQISTTTLGRCLWNLDAACSFPFYPDADQRIGRSAGSGRLTVPGSPGRAKRFYPYPPSRRRRR
ncbi:MAG TPA: hypothetical protein VFQ30_19200 [Ktedonobacteraceae bacterium]|nr:hypothetical protein [Ktedonobacteraceae bacterium]